MAITPGSTGRADDFIYRTEAQADRTDDEGRIPKLESDGRIHSDFTIPTGVVVEYEGDTGNIPSGFLLCDGSEVSRATYADLFAKIGTKHGVGNGTTTFNLPNRKGRVSVGYDSSQSEFNALAKTGGAKTHTLTSSEIPSHSHNFYSDTSYYLQGAKGGGSQINPWAQSGNGYTKGSEITATQNNSGGGGAHNNLQPYITTLFIIKT